MTEQFVLTKEAAQQVLGMAREAAAGNATHMQIFVPMLQQLCECFITAHDEILRREQKLETNGAELAHLHELINRPEMENFLRGVHVEAVHQIERWGTANDRAKRPADWFWLVGYLAGKVLHATNEGNTEKALHHTISTAAALYNWHCAISGTDVSMCPGRSDLADLVDGNFPGEAPIENAA